MYCDSGLLLTVHYDSQMKSCIYLLLDDQEQTRAEDEVTEAIKYALIKGWSLSKVREAEHPPLKQKTVCIRRPKNKKTAKEKVRGRIQIDHEDDVYYEPDVADLSKVGMGVDLFVSSFPVYVPCPIPMISIQ